MMGCLPDDLPGVKRGFNVQTSSFATAPRLRCVYTLPKEVDFMLKIDMLGTVLRSNYLAKVG